MSENNQLPELLCPAGSMEALEAAIEGGADAVYLGGTAMNARLNAGNFSPHALREAVRLAHAYGVKLYLTLNTLIADRERSAFLAAAADAADAGIDALILADIGGAGAIHKYLPHMELHASTQMSGHNSAMGKELRQLGFCRMVAARELSERDLRRLVADSPIETEVFVHGALCVSCSGQCLFSSLVGGRSGNRGACAQPCRLPFSGVQGRAGEQYPLSLKDLSLAVHLPKLIDMGVASLKIEGRMKSPEYVRDTTQIFRRLLDERRAATQEELLQLADSFSRSGFTDGYFTERIGKSMLGVRREADKQATRSRQSFVGLTRKIPLDLTVKLPEDAPASLSLSDGRATVTVYGDIPQKARTAPMNAESVLRSICRLGGTPYQPRKTEAEVASDVMFPVSKLNELRRLGVEALAQTSSPARQIISKEPEPLCPKGIRATRTTARFQCAKQVTPNAEEFFDRIFLPLFSYESVAQGVVVPPVVYDHSFSELRQGLQQAAQAGARYAMVGNLGHLIFVREAGLIPIGDFRLNITNNDSAALYESMGLEELLLSPELTLPQMRDIGGNTAAIVYGRLPLMTLEKCVIREMADCKTCDKGAAVLTDRRGVVFPVLREWEHRNVIYNSLPTCMSDRGEDLRRYRITNRHFLFSVESPSEVDAIILAYRNGSPLPQTVRRM